MQNTAPHVAVQGNDTGIHTFFSSRTEALAGILFSQLPDADARRANPFAHTPIIVPNSGMKRYLELHIAEHFGICAHIDIGFASRFLSDCYRCVLPEQTRQKYPAVRQLAFAILALWQSDTLPDALAQTVLPDLLSTCQTPKQRYYLAEQVARLLSQYLNERPELMRAWQRGETLYHNAHEDWQMALFRQLRLGQFCGNEVQQLFHTTLSALENHRPKNHHRKILPETVHLFGFHSMPPVQLADFMALATQTTVNAYIFNPSVSYWKDIVPEAVKAEKQLTAQAEAELMTCGNPLLSTWGQSGKYLLEALGDSAVTPLNIDEDFHHESQSVLSWVQNEVRAGSEIADSDTLQTLADKETAVGDFSLSLHAAASPRREVEILYDHLCEQFQRGVLNPSDVLVMVPDLRDYAPHIEAVFGAQPQTAVPFSLANQTAGQADPDTQTFLALLNVVDSDFSVQALFDVLSEDNIRHAFQLSLNDVQTIHYWLSESRTAKHFYDKTHGRGGSLEKLLDALLLAVVGGADCVVDTPRFMRSALPSYQSGQRDSLIGFCRFLQVFSRYSRLKTQSKTLSAWRDTLLALAMDFLGQDNSLTPRLQQWHDEVFAAEGLEMLSDNQVFDYETIITDVVNVLDSDELHGPFLSGGISFCAMVPMRSIPSVMIALLGLNQNFPRVVGKDPLDLRQLRPLWSDRNVNKEYRYFFLETLMAAREQLYLSYVGQDDKSGQAIAPSVLVEDLLGFIGRYHPDYVTAIHNRYPLQGFSEAHKKSTFQPLYLTPPPLQNPRDLPHVESNLPHVEDSLPHVAETIYPTLPTQFNAYQLSNYLYEPTAFYLQRYLSASPIALPDKPLAEHDAVALENGLDKWHFNQVALNHRLFDQDGRQQLIQQNRLPPPSISQALLASADDIIAPLSRALAVFTDGNSQSRSQFIQHSHNGQRFTLLWDCPRYLNGGEIGGQWGYQTSALNVKKIMCLWVNHVLMNHVAGLPNYHSHLLTLDKGKVTHTTLTPLQHAGQAQTALEQLLDLLQLYFQQPYAVVLSMAGRRAAELLCYKDNDYPLYPRLMQTAKTADDEVLQALLQPIDEQLQAHLQQQELS